MSNTFLVAKELHESLINHPLVIEYKKYAKMIKENPLYTKMDLDLRNKQKEIINNYSEELVSSYKKEKEEFLKDPIVSKYLSLKEELNKLLNTLQDIINDNL